MNSSKMVWRLTYDNPATYQGPIVEGWPPGKKRNLESYLRLPFLIQPKGWGQKIFNDFKMKMEMSLKLQAIALRYSGGGPLSTWSL